MHKHHQHLLLHMEYHHEQQNQSNDHLEISHPLSMVQDKQLHQPYSKLLYFYHLQCLTLSVL
jgi:hypothetical protein